jgi:hypothetical protein
MSSSAAGIVDQANQEIVVRIGPTYQYLCVGELTCYLQEVRFLVYNYISCLLFSMCIHLKISKFLLNIGSVGKK